MLCDTCSRKGGSCECHKCVTAGKALHKASFDLRTDCVKCGLGYSAAKIKAVRDACPHYRRINQPG
jgi:predicted  nucleic acid-binding Zn-ribbon protein